MNQFTTLWSAPYAGQPGDLVQYSLTLLEHKRMIECAPSNRVIVAAGQDTMSPAVMIQQAHTTSHHGDAETVCFVVATLVLPTVWVGKVPANRRQQFVPT